MAAPIAFLSVHSSPLDRVGAGDNGGMSTYLLGLSQALGAAGQRVDLFTRAAPGEGLSVRKVAPLVRLVSVDDGLGPLTKDALYPHLPRVAAAIASFWRRENLAYRALFSHYWLSGCAGSLLAHEGLPHLIMFHTLGRFKNESCRDEQEPERRLREEETLVRRCDRVFAASRGERARMLAAFDLSPEKFVLLPAGVDRTLFYPPAQVRKKENRPAVKTILAVGRLEPVKGFDLLLEAAALLPENGSWRVLFAGGEGRKSALAHRLQERAAKLGLSGRVTFSGPVEHRRLPALYREALVTVCPSHYESFGLVVLESLACGTPVVAGPVGVVPELAGNGVAAGAVTMIEQRSPLCWAGAIHSLLEGPARLPPGLISNLLAPYSWQVAADTLLHTLDEISPPAPGLQTRIPGV